MEEKQIPYQYIEVNPYNKPESLISLNPRGLVPTLSCPTDPPRPLFESTVILEYIEEAYPDHSPAFLPNDPYERARARIWIDYVTSRIIPSFHRFLQFQSNEAEAAEHELRLDHARQDFLGHLKAWIQEAHQEGPFFLGSEISLTDLVLAPWAVRLWVFDYFKGGLGIPAEGAGGDDELTWSRWRKWIKAIESRDSVRNTLSEREHYLPIYKRYADNVAQSELAKATRAGRGVP